MNILLTGGAGYIGSHTAVELLEAGHAVVIADNLSNSSASVIDRVERITGMRPRFYRIDVADGGSLSRLFDENSIDVVIHFAGLKAVGESTVKPLLYYRANLDAALTTLETMAAHGCRRFIFSSSATVYGTANPVPYTEEMPAGKCSNPYGRTKVMIEEILRDVSSASPGFSAVILRYFNPVGAHASGLIGEMPNGTPNNLMPCLCQTAVGRLPRLNVFGGDYSTPDGTCVRDYIHVTDLARGHAAALEYVCSHTGIEVFNLGTGRGRSVLEVLKTFERVNALTLPYAVVPRRPGDLAECWSDASKAERLLGWKAEKSLDDMCRDSWNWTRKAFG